MKKKIALLLVLALCLSAMVGLTAWAEERAVVESAPDVAFANVSIKTNVELLFAVPVDDVSVTFNKEDGSMQNLCLYLWKGASEDGYRLTSAERLESEGVIEKNGKVYAVFTYNGLTAMQMTDVVYVCTSYVSPTTNVRYFGNIIDYSIAEWANYYTTTNELNRALVDAVIAYGAAIQEYNEYTPEGYFIGDELNSVTVRTYLDGSLVSEQITKLFKAGERFTLSAPAMKNATLSSWDLGALTDLDPSKDGVQLEANGDVTVSVSFSSTTPSAVKIWDSSFDDYVDSVDSLTDGSNTDPDTWNIDNTYNNSKKSEATGATAGSSGRGVNLFSSTAKGIRANTGRVYGEDEYYGVTHKILEDETGNKYLQWAHNCNSAIYVNAAGSHDTVLLAAQGLGENYTAITIKFSLKRNASGGFAETAGVRLRANGTGIGTECVRVFNTTAEGTVRLYKSSGTMPVVGTIAEEGWSHFAIVVDIENLRYYGYMMNEQGVYVKTAETSFKCPSNYVNVYEWIKETKKIQWESSDRDTEFESTVTEDELAYLKTLSGDARKAELYRLVEYYYGMNVDNYEIHLGNACE